MSEEAWHEMIEGRDKEIAMLKDSLEAYKIMTTERELREGRLLVEGDRLRERIAELTEEILALRAYS